ncbi:alpha/beta hydrolase family protein [Kitasatospora phosalacinea]|uniref:alpha/beta hydrolase family protein n=1 Tax=Kitasatospora phosalacinea TaxID=2065 RepID=UPI000527EBD3|nr:alpha/beta hydrolase [Kitasatospora phosalacinea]
MKRSTLPVALAATALLLTACSGGSGKTGAAPGPSADTYGCLTRAEAEKGSFTLDAGTSGGSSLDAYYRDSDAGHAKVAVIFSHQRDGSLCEWALDLPAFTKAGYAVLAYTSEGDVTEVIKAGSAHLKSKGVGAVALVGASKGAAGSLVAAKLDNPLPIKAVVSLSSPASYPQFNAALAVTTVRTPTYFAAEQADSPFNDNARALYDASVAEDKQLKIYPGGSHGAPLLRDGALPDVLDYLARHAPAAG